MTVTPVPGSFRDPAGFVYRDGNKFYRALTHQGAEDFASAEATGLPRKWIAESRLAEYTDGGTVPASLAAEGVTRILELSAIPFISYPYEWSFRGLQKAASLQLDLLIEALDEDLTFSDASAYNVQFNGPAPVFIDHLSVVPYRDGQFWTGHQQFCTQFLNPLLLRALVGIPHNAIYRGALEGITTAELNHALPLSAKLSLSVLMHVVLPAKFEKSGRQNRIVQRDAARRKLPKPAFRNMVQGLRKWIERLEPKGVASTTWADYTRTHSYDDDAVAEKTRFVAEFVEQVSPVSVLDIGCNTGDYSMAALRAGATRVIGLEQDSGAVEIAFARAQAENSNFLPLKFDAANPSPMQGWRETERMGFEARGRFDAVLALAVLHHMAIGRNIPLAQAVDWIIDRAEHGVIEFVPKSDPMAQELMALKGDLFDDYGEATFDAAVNARADIVSRHRVAGTDRILVRYSRRTGA